MSNLDDALRTSEAARALGSIRSAKKAQSSKANALKATQARQLARVQRTDFHRCDSCGKMPWLGRTVAIIVGHCYCAKCLRATGIAVEKENKFRLIK